MKLVCALAVFAMLTVPTAGEAIFNPDFETDKDLDGVPDGWTQVYGPNRFRYAYFTLTTEKPFSGKQSLYYKLAGTSAKLQATPFAINMDFSYRVTVHVKCREMDSLGLRETHAHLGIDFLDKAGKTVGTVKTEDVTGTMDWFPLELRMPQPPPKTTHARVFIAVNGRDITGGVYFDDTQIMKLPRVQIITAQPGNIFSENEEKIINILITGLKKEIEYKGTALLVDEFSNSIFNATDVFTPKPNGHHPKAYRLNLKQPGAYKFTYTVNVPGAKSSATTHLGVIKAGSEAPLRQDFGVVLNPNYKSPKALAAVAMRLGVGWVKTPLFRSNVPYDDNVQSLNDEVIRELSLQAIHVVGALGPTPYELIKKTNDNGAAQTMHNCIGTLFTPDNREIWQPLIENVVGRYADRLDGWQLGTDNDSSCRHDSYMVVAKYVSGVIKRMTSAPSAGIPVDPVYGRRDLMSLKPAFVNLRIDDSVVPEEIPALLNSIRAPSAKWITIDLESKKKYHTGALIRILTEKLIHAKRSRASVIFLDPFQDDEKGLVNLQNTPTRLYFVVNTLLNYLSERNWTGTKILPNGSVVHIFEDKDSIILIGWNDKGSVEEREYLGENLTSVTLTGSGTPIKAEKLMQTITFGPEPIILTGIDASLFRTKKSFRFAETNLASTLTEQIVTISLTNFYSLPIRGAVELILPRGWVASKTSFRFSMGIGSTWSTKFSLRLPSSQTTGFHRIRARIFLVGEKKQLVNVQRRLNIVLRDILTKIDVQRIGGDLALISIRATNTGKSPITLSAFVQPFRRPRTGRTFKCLEPGSSTEHIFTVSSISELGPNPVWLGLREIGGKRIYNRQIRFAARKGDYYEILP